MLTWRAGAFRTRAEAACVPQPENVLLPGRRLGELPRGGVSNAAARRVRFDGRTDPAASYRTCDPVLAGARYQRMLTTDTGARTTAFDDTGVHRPPSQLRERAVCPRLQSYCGRDIARGEFIHVCRSPAAMPC